MALKIGLVRVRGMASSVAEKLYPVVLCFMLIPCLSTFEEIAREAAVQERANIWLEICENVPPAKKGQ